MPMAPPGESRARVIETPGAVELSAEQREPVPTEREPATGTMIIVPLRNTLIFPGPIVPLSVARPASIRAVEEAVKSERPIGLIAQRNEVDEPRWDDLYGVGTM